MGTVDCKNVWNNCEIYIVYSYIQATFGMYRFLKNDAICE